mmetsp:Transcript_24406/g.30328  ORF Transcript_24406/g.30328 Transcript_24406/m.30328 type:complete len:102 (+) Transcript_24406:574-879(+)
MPVAAQIESMAIAINAEEENKEDERMMPWQYDSIHISKSAALQIVFEYFQPHEMLKMQLLNKKFYKYTIVCIMPRCPLNRARPDMTQRMLRDDRVVMLFGG